MRMREEMRQQHEFMEASNAHNQAMYQVSTCWGLSASEGPQKHDLTMFSK
jgi:hypothetical protein